MRTFRIKVQSLEIRSDPHTSHQLLQIESFLKFVYTNLYTLIFHGSRGVLTGVQIVGLVTSLNLQPFEPEKIF